MTDAGGASEPVVCLCTATTHTHTHTHTHRTSETMKLLSLSCFSSEVTTTLRSDKEASQQSSSCWVNRPDHEATFTLERLQITDDVCEGWSGGDDVPLRFCRSSPLSGPAQHGSKQQPINHPVRQTQLDSSWGSGRPHHYIYISVFRTTVWYLRKKVYSQSYTEDKQVLA